VRSRKRGIGLNAELRAVLFDMDGTILTPEEHSSLLEFKARWGIPMEQLIVPNLSRLPEDAYANFIELESSLAQHSVLRSGVPTLLRVLKDAGIRTALVTNNSTQSARVVTEKHGIGFDLILTRDDEAMKPAPDMLLKALEVLGVPTPNAVMVGDTGADVGAAEAAQVGHCYLLAEVWNEQFSGANLTRVRDMHELERRLLK
jgi:HAD superfamily hydrolase (TIGR01549 family)